MNIHEYQAKQLLAKTGVPLLRGKVATTVDEACNAAQELGGSVWVVKAQIHAGGRGKGGGVKLAKSIDEVKSHAKAIIGMNLVTPQTGPQGKKVKSVYIEQGCDIAKEYYISLLIDRNTSCVTLVCSTEGGMDIEEVASKTPEKILSCTIDPVCGFQAFHGRKLAYGLNLKQTQISGFIKVVQALYDCFCANDASLIEINPLVLCKDDTWVALDAKMNFDDNALFRHKEIVAMRDLDEEDPTEVEASKHELNYIRLDGNIGCMVNGAGLAMATMDIIKLYGCAPANFLDVGGGATKERVTQAFKIILSDSNVEAILVNIFGGIMRCDIIAEGIVAAAKEVSLNVPLVVRLQGTNVDLGRKILQQSGLSILSAESLADAAEKVVSAVRRAA